MFSWNLDFGSTIRVIFIDYVAILHVHVLLAYSTVNSICICTCTPFCASFGKSRPSHIHVHVCSEQERVLMFLMMWCSLFRVRKKPCLWNTGKS